MTQAFTQEATEDVKVAIMVVKEAENPVTNSRLVCIMPRACGPALKQSTLDYKITDKY